LEELYLMKFTGLHERSKSSGGLSRYHRKYIVEEKSYVTSGANEIDELKEKEVFIELPIALRAMVSQKVYC